MSDPIIQVVQLDGLPEWSFLCDPKLFRFKHDQEYGYIRVCSNQGQSLFDIALRDGAIYPRTDCSGSTDVIAHVHLEPINSPLRLNPNHTICLQFDAEVQVSYINLVA